MGYSDMSDLTIYDIAKLANVSASTVSKVLNGRCGVNEETAKRIQSIMKSHGFRPRWQAGGSDKTVAFYLPPYKGVTQEDDYITRIIGGCFDRLSEAGYSMQLLNPMHLVFSGHDYHFTSSIQPCGIIAIPCVENYSLCNFLLCDNTLPCVVIGSLPETTTNAHPLDQRNIVMDDYMAGYQAAMYLLSHHHRHCMVVTPCQRDIGHQQRCIGIQAAMATQKECICTVKELEYDCNLAKNGEQLALELACSTERPDALIFTQGRNCVGFMHGCNFMHLPLPESFSVMAFEDGEELTYSMPPVTVMHVPCNTLCDIAVNVLLAQMEDREMPPVVDIRHELIVRQSVRQ